nr:MAG TPA: hypothetical protein [Caudoviricetes sp.]
MTGFRFKSKRDNKSTASGVIPQRLFLFCEQIITGKFEHKRATFFIF